MRTLKGQFERVYIAQAAAGPADLKTEILRMKSVRRKLTILFAIATGATIFQAAPTSCYKYAAVLGVSSFDFCTVLNCQNGSFFNLCASPVILLDCPNVP